ncbi:MAG TPA: ATP-binding protein, partial [Spirochaetia bacterium]
MPEPDREFQQRLLATFREEADEHSQAIARGLAEMESAATDEARASAVEQVLREAHSLKGAARAVGLRPIEASCQTLESLLSRIKRGETALDAAGLEAMRGHAQEIRRLLAQGPEAESPADKLPPASPPAEKAPEETVRVSSSRLDRLMLQVEELIPARWAATHRSAEAQELRARMGQWRREYDKVQRATLAMQRPAGRGPTTIPGPGQAAGAGPGQSPGQGPTAGPGRGQSPATERADRSLTALLEFLRWSNEFSRGIEERIGQIARSMDREQRVLGAMVDSLRQETRLLLLRPFSSITEAFPRLVQDLSRQQGKEIALNVVGAGIEIDRRILQEMKDGLIHILRNSVDHGIETPQARREAKKAARGTITLSIERTNASRVAILIEDDGGGIDLKKVRDAAVRAGLRTAQQIAAMGDAETVDLIFQSGLSTSPRVTDISGRGLGMAIVREKVERLGGDISVESRPGQGTSITLLLPLALSTLRGVIVRVATRLYIIPVTFVERVALVPPDDGEIRTIE